MGLTRSLQSFKTSGGRHELDWRTVGDQGAITFTVQVRPINPNETCGITATDAGVHYLPRFIGIHSLAEPNGWQGQRLDGCEALADRTCWYDRAALAADRLLEKWAAFAFNDEVIYGELAEWYRDRLAAVSTPAETWPARCVHCKGEVAGLLADCPRPECIPREIADAVRLDRDIEASEDR